MRKNLCILNAAFTLGGGAEKISFELGQALKQKGFSVYYYSFIDSEKIYPKRNKFYYTLNERKNSFFKYINMFHYAKNFAKFCKQNKIKQIISHSERSNIVALLAKKYFFNDLNVFCVVHNIQYFNKFYFKFILKKFYPLANKIVCVSKEIESKIKFSLKLINTITIYNFFDFNKIDTKLKEKIDLKDKHLFNNKKSAVFINIGRLTDQKGQGYLIRSFKKVVEKDSACKLLILGDGHLKQQYLNLITKLNLEKNVFLLGIKSNVFPYLKKSDCFVFSSLWEGFGLVIVEALLAETPVISTDCSAGPREILAKSLPLNKKINYPYKSKLGVLCSPFRKKTQLNALKKESLSVAELIFANQLIKFTKSLENYDISRIDLIRFNKKKVISKWIQLLKESKTC